MIYPVDIDMRDPLDRVLSLIVDEEIEMSGIPALFKVCNSPLPRYPHPVESFRFPDDLVKMRVIVYGERFRGSDKFIQDIEPLLDEGRSV